MGDKLDNPPTAGRAVVVGGGIAGILSALTLAERYRHVVLVERAQECGGLLRSWTEPTTGASFDYGSHFVATTGLPEVDELLLTPVTDEWFACKPLKSGTYYQRLGETSPCPDIRCWPSDVYHRAVVELLSAESNPNARDLYQHLLGHVGETITNHFYAPVMDKLMGRSLRELHPNAYRLFTGSRLIALTASATRAIKQLERYDDRLSYHSFYEGLGCVESYYPNRGGVGQWVKGLLKMLADRGVEIRTCESVERIHHQGRRVQAVSLRESGEMLPCEFLAWSIPVSACLAAANVPFSASRPEIQSSYLYHYVFDKPFLTELEFVTCFDPGLRNFRTTMYSNIGGRHAAPYACTVEVISPPSAEHPDWPDMMARELRDMGLVAPDAKELFRHSETVAGFPVMTNEFVDTALRLRREAEATLDNAVFVGKARGTSFFMHQVLRETYEAVNAQMAKAEAA